MQLDSKSSPVALDASGIRLGIVVSRFNSSITEQLVKGALESIVENGGQQELIQVVRVPGSLEIPLTLKLLAEKKSSQALIALGAIIRGDTLHFELVANEVSRGITQVSLEFNIPVTSGIIAAENVQQALDRAGGSVGNYGSNAALAAIEMVQIKNVIASQEILG